MQLHADVILSRAKDPRGRLTSVLPTSSFARLRMTERGDVFGSGSTALLSPRLGFGGRLWLLFQAALVTAVDFLDLGLGDAREGDAHGRVLRGAVRAAEVDGVFAEHLVEVVHGLEKLAALLLC